MVLPISVDTPRTEVGNATFMTHADLDISMEQSFRSPAHGQNDLISQARQGRKGPDLRTPRSRVPLADRRNAGALPRGEFTPLLKSVAKTNLSRRNSKGRTTQTPALPRNGRGQENSPALPPDMSGFYAGDLASSYVGNETEATPMPQIASSSAASTPLAMLPRKDGGGVIADGANMMTLREQENIINKVEKENFGLKLKIHFLEEALRKAGPEFSEAALKENTDLKVDKVTMQDELRRYRKTLVTAERELEKYRQQVLEAQERARSKHADEGQREELRRLRQALAESDAEVQELREKLEAGDSQHADVARLKDEMSDLEAELREKNRIVEEQEEEMEQLKERFAGEGGEADKVLEEMAGMKDRMQELEAQQTEHDDALHSAREEVEDARAAVTELEEQLEHQGAELAAAHDRAQDLLDEGGAEALGSARADLDRSRTEIRTLEDLVDRLRREKSEADEARAAAERQVAQHHENLLSLKVEERAAALESTQAELGRYRQRVESLEATLAQLRTDLDAAERDANEATRDRDGAEARARSKDEALQDAQEDLAECRREIDHLEEATDEAKAELADAMTKTHAAEESQRLAESEALSTRQELRRAVDDVRQCREEIDRLTAGGRGVTADESRIAGAEKDELRRQVTDLEGTIERLQLEVRQAGHRYELAADDKARTERLLSEGQAKIRTVEQSSQQLTQELAEARQQRRELEDKAQGLEDEVVLLQGSLDDHELRAREEVAAARLERSDQLAGLQQRLSDARAHREDDVRAGKEKMHRLEIRAKEVEGLLQPRGPAGGSLRGSDRAMVEERRELHAKLTEAKVDVEELRERVSEREGQIDDLVQKQEEVRMQLQRVREERAVQTQRAQASLSELETLRQRYDQVAKHHQRLQQGWAEERAAMMQRVRFPNVSSSSVRGDGAGEVARLQRQLQERDRTYQGEVKGLAKQIMYLRRKCEREQDFRADLAFAKRYFLLQIEMYDTWYVLSFSLSTSTPASTVVVVHLHTGTDATCRSNHADLQMIANMGIHPERSIREKRPSMRSVGLMVMAALRMQRRRQEWAMSRMIKESSIRALAQTRRTGRKSAVV
ncbi:MAG: hypothetical protein M1838_002699 [Thelocarpon superellum]|nr:MAG: hypothetical protein M1838_002699 [Thelocarpon superellum]